MDMIRISIKKVAEEMKKQNPIKVSHNSKLEWDFAIVRALEELYQLESKLFLECQDDK